MSTAEAASTVERRVLTAEPISEEAFAPFGHVIVATEDMVPAGAIDAALDLWPLFDAIDRLYVSPVILQVAEKNA